MSLDEYARVGQLLAGKYRIERVLGAGGMGVVVAARHLELETPVAIKLLLPETLGNPEAVARFTREARAAVRIRSEHVARVSDVGRLENGAPYMVMEYLEGLDLSAWLAQRGPLPVPQAIDFVLQASEALAEAHALGIVHRDLKPANLFVVTRADGGLSVKVLDFGISKAMGVGGPGGDGSMTRTSAMLGSPLYMSPEQIQSAKDVDARSDIWALGVILYELCTGATPFGGEHLAELVFAIISNPPRPLREVRPDVPPALEPVIAKCLSKARSARFGSIAELAQALSGMAPARASISLERITGVTPRVVEKPQDAPGAPLGVQAQAGPPAAGTHAAWGSTNPTKAAPPGVTTGSQPAARRGRMALLAGAALSLAVAGALTLGRALGGAAAPAAAASSLPSAPSARSSSPEPTTEPSVTATSSPAVLPAPPHVDPAPSAATAPSVKPPSARPRSARPESPPRPKLPATVGPAPTHDPWGGTQH